MESSDANDVTHQTDTKAMHDLVDRDEALLRWDSPRLFSDLLDEHFPLFVTFDQVRNTPVSCSTSMFNLCSCAVCWRQIFRG